MSIDQNKMERIKERIYQNINSATEANQKVVEEELTAEEQETIAQDVEKNTKRESIAATVLRVITLGLVCYLLLIIPPSWGGAILLPVMAWIVGIWWSKLVGTHMMPEYLWSPLETVTHYAYLDMLLIITLLYMITYPIGG